MKRGRMCLVWALRSGRVLGGGVAICRPMHVSSSVIHAGMHVGGDAAAWQPSMRGDECLAKKMRTDDASTVEYVIGQRRQAQRRRSARRAKAGCAQPQSQLRCGVRWFGRSAHLRRPFRTRCALDANRPALSSVEWDVKLVLQGPIFDNYCPFCSTKRMASPILHSILTTYS